MARAFARLGQVEMKHGVKLDVVNFYNDEAGNADLPEKFKQTAKANRLAVTRKRRRIFIGVAALVTIALAAGLWIFRSSREVPVLPLADKSIAVLRVKNLSEDKAKHCADGVQGSISSPRSDIHSLLGVAYADLGDAAAAVCRRAAKGWRCS